MANGIDSILNATENAFAGDQQGLQQRYAMTQELTDLMTLQKMKSDYEAADRELKMAMGEQPTIAQQRPQEVMQLAQNQVAQRVGGVAQKQQQDMQKQQQRMMQAAARPQPPMGGVPGLMQPPPQAAPPMAAAGGGMVRGYRGGGIVPYYAQGGPIVALRQGGEALPPGTQKPGAKINSLPTLGAVPATGSQGTDEQVKRDAQEYMRLQQAIGNPELAQYKQRNQQLMQELINRMGNNHAKVMQYVDSLKGMAHPKSELDASLKGMSGGGIVALQEGGDVEEENLMDKIVDIPADLAQWAMDNPVDAASVGLMLVPGFGWAKVGYTGAKSVLGPLARKHGPKVVQQLQKLVTRKPNIGRTRGGRATDPFTPPMRREFSLPRTAGVTGVALNAGNRLFGGGEEPPPPAPEPEQRPSNPLVGGGIGALAPFNPDVGLTRPDTPNSQVMLEGAPQRPPQNNNMPAKPTPQQWMGNMIAQHGTPTPPEPTPTEQLFQQYKDIYAQQNDPKELAYQRLWGSMGDGLRNTAKNNLAIRNQQETRALGGVKDLLNMSQAADIAAAEQAGLGERARLASETSLAVANSQAATSIRTAIINTTSDQATVEKQLEGSMDRLEKEIASLEKRANRELTQDAAIRRAQAVLENLGVQAELMGVNQQLREGNLTEAQARDATNQIIDRTLSQYDYSLGQGSGQTNSPAFNQVR